MSTWFRRLGRRFAAFADSLWLELFVGIGSGLLSLQSGQQNNLWSQIANVAISAIVGGSVPLLIKLYIRLGEAVPTVNTLKNVLQNFNNLENRFLPTLYVTETMKSFHERWIEWRISLNLHGDIGELEETAWTLLAEAYLHEESEKIASKYVLTNTNRYTVLVTEASRYLEKYHSSNGSSPQQKKMLRYQITGMLPEEFYNGSQIEFTANSSQPIFFCHKWENYQDFYAPEYKGLNEKLNVKRCIVVREPNLRREEISALSTLTDLEGQAELSMIDRERRVFDDLPIESESVKKRLFRKCAQEQQQNHNDLISSILGRQRYNYWPVALTQECGSDKQWVPLLDVFSKAFHGDKPNDASYCALNENTWNVIKNNRLLKDCFKPGWIPEIALFGGLGSGKDPECWYFGILGHWRPFTSDIELRFLTSEQTRQLYAAFTSDIYEKSTNKGTLLSLKSRLRPSN
ncbi:MAG: hypothetical protein RM347_006550 [Nostoc sp. ChiQUE02]|uniref:hypothetical protein n=1 Tax=Nostoc sp. ChiQUE02 TaxID=3075377 RepID=UPI002AD55D5A|nr:hypothetical protein [Nostoc sp. ChiQUE02]MDZ8230466.1 hypothetical protein [Nostoc sp. ChiQUE02]